MEAPAQGIPVELPLRGEWTVILSPAYLGERHWTRTLAMLTGHMHAYDFVRPGQRAGLLPSLFGRSALDDATWSAPVYAPFDGEVAAVGDGWPDKSRIAWLSELWSMLFRRPRLTADEIRPAVGNYVILRSEGAVAFLAHLRCGSITVAQGQRVKAGQPLGEVGHSGTSFAPHLHFQLMDRANPMEARGLPFCFRQYERWADGGWTPVQHGNPRRGERIRL